MGLNGPKGRGAEAENPCKRRVGETWDGCREEGRKLVSGLLRPRLTQRQRLGDHFFPKGEKGLLHGSARSCGANGGR